MISRSRSSIEVIGSRSRSYERNLIRTIAGCPPSNWKTILLPLSFLWMRWIVETRLAHDDDDMQGRVSVWQMKTWDIGWPRGVVSVGLVAFHPDLDTMRMRGQPAPPSTLPSPSSASERQKAQHYTINPFNAAAPSVTVWSVQRHTGLIHQFWVLTFGHSGTQSWAPECPNVTNQNWWVRHQYGKV